MVSKIKSVSNTKMLREKKEPVEEENISLSNRMADLMKTVPSIYIYIIIK